MNDAFITLQTMAAIALYERQGVIAAVQFLTQNGWTNEQAIDMLSIYDTYASFVDSCEFDKLPKAP